MKIISITFLLQVFHSTAMTMHMTIFPRKSAKPDTNLSREGEMEKNLLRRKFSMLPKMIR